LHQTFLQAKTFTKKAYAIFCFAKRNISLVMLSFLKKGLLCPFTQQGGDRGVWCEGFG